MRSGGDRQCRDVGSDREKLEKRTFWETVLHTFTQCEIKCFLAWAQSQQHH